MDYEKAYQEALERARIEYKNEQSKGNIWVCEKLSTIFPELKESEDKKIRKELISFFTKRDEFSKSEPFDGLSNKQIIAWLEKQAEQKPTPKFKIGDTIHKIGENTVFPRTIEKIEDGDYVCNNSHSFINIKFQDDYELVEQKPAWSEEDEKMCQETIDWFEKKCFPYALESENPARASIKWLKSLKDRVQPQPKQEWSEEDKSMYIRTLGILGKCYMGELPTKVEEELRWFKSIKPNHWKPSKEQMKAIKYFIDFHRPQANASIEGWSEFKHLESLYNDIEKL